MYDSNYITYIFTETPRPKTPPPETNRLAHEMSYSQCHDSKDHCESYMSRYQLVIVETPFVHPYT